MLNETITQFSSLSSQSIQYETSKIISVKFKIHKSKVSQLIGKGGSNIKNIQNLTKTRLKIFDDKYNSAINYAELTINGVGTDVKDTIYTHLLSYIIDDDTSTDSFSNFHSSNSLDNNSNKTLFSTEKKEITIDWNKLYDENDKAEKKRWESADPINKMFYIESNEVSNQTESEIMKKRLDMNNITVHCNSMDIKIPKPVCTFEQAFLCEKSILDLIKAAKYDKPTPIQCQAWPIILSGHDLIGIAQTGTGKTLAFLLPALVHINGQAIPKSERHGPTVIIMVPTRELAIQIHEEIKKFSFKDIKSAVIYGGADRKEQIKLCDDHVDIVVATPGRLIDLVSYKKISLLSTSYLVLDEADRMLDMGFEPEIRKIILDIRPDRQTIMTSATWPLGVKMMADRYCKNPIQINVGSMDLMACHTINQQIEIVDQFDKKDLFFKFISNMKPSDKAIIFVGKKIIVDELSCDLSLSEFSHVGIQCIHGSREQTDREQAIDDFKNGVARILIATDVASRGLDISDITHVINYDFPKTIDEYVHRIGRTGRAGKNGTALTFMTRQDWAQASELIKILEEANQSVPEELLEMSQRYQKKMEQRENDDTHSSFKKKFYINKYNNYF